MCPRSRFKEGRRIDFKLDLLKLKAEKMQKVQRRKHQRDCLYPAICSQQVGEWTAAEGLVISDKYAFTEGRPPNITLKVLSRIEEPFVMFRKVCRV